MLTHIAWIAYKYGICSKMKKTTCKITAKQHLFFYNVVSTPSVSINSLCSLMYSITSSLVRYFIDRHLLTQSLKFRHT